MEWISKREIFQVRNKLDLEYFCKIGMNLRLGHKMELSQNIFVDMELDLEILVQEEQRE